MHREPHGGVPREENIAKLRADHPELGHLDDEKAMAVRRYIGADANDLNSALRGDTADAIADRPYLRPEIGLLHSALDDMPRVETAETPKAFRGTAVTEADLPGLLERYQPDATVEEPACTSASKDIPPEYFGSREDKPVRVRFVIEELQHARELAGTNPEENEVLWADRNHFGVRDVEAVGNREWIVRMIDQGRN